MLTFFDDMYVFLKFVLVNKSLNRRFKFGFWRLIQETEQTIKYALEHLAYTLIFHFE